MFDKTVLLHGGRREALKFYVLTALFFSIALLPKLTTILIIIYALVILSDFKKDNVKKLLEQKALLLFVIMYFLLIVGLAYTESLETGLSKIQTQLALLIFPLLLGGGSISANKRNWYLSSFVTGVITTTLICLLHALFRYSSTGSIYVVDQFSRKHNVFFYNELSDFINLHPTYFSIYLGFAIFFLLVQLLKKKNTYLALLTVLLFVTLFLTSSKSGIFSFLVVALIFFGYKMVKYRSKIYFLLGIGIVLGSVAMFAINSMFYERSINSATSFYNLSDEPYKAINESTSIRLGMWKLSWEAIKSAPVFGHGTGSVLKTMNDICLNNYSFSVCESLRNKNSHNQYLNFMVSNGILFGIIFMTALAFGVLKAINKKDILFQFFLASMILNFFFESLLQRERGIVYFMLFMVLFTISNNDNQTVNEE